MATGQATGTSYTATALQNFYRSTDAAQNGELLRASNPLSVPVKLIRRTVQQLKSN